MAEHSHGPEMDGNLKVAFFLNLGFTILEVIGGVWTNSIAILSDAVHDSGDSLSLGIAWYLQKLSHRGPDAQFTYGYRRFSTLGAVVTGSVLFVGLSFVGWHAIERLQSPQEVKAPGMMLLAIIGILFNGAAAWKLHGSHSLNEKGGKLALAGRCTRLGGGVSRQRANDDLVNPDRRSDPLAWHVSLRALECSQKHEEGALVFLQGAAEHFDVEQFDQEIRKVAQVLGSHHTHTWAIDGEHHVFSTHLVLQRGTNRETILAAKRRVKELLGSVRFTHVTIEVEIEGENEMAPPEHG